MDVGGRLLNTKEAKNIYQHKSCYGFQDVGNESELRKHQDDDENIKTMTIGLIC